MRIVALLLCVVGVVFAGVPHARAVSYEATDLGTLGGSASSAHGINNLGQVVGRADTSLGISHAFLWQDGVMIDLGTLGGGESYAHGINNCGWVIGMSGVYADEGYQYHAVLWKPVPEPSSLLALLLGLCGLGGGMLRRKVR